MLLLHISYNICDSKLVSNYIYIQRLFNNNTLDLNACLNQLEQALKTEENICKTNNKKEKILKYNFIYENS